MSGNASDPGDGLSPLLESKEDDSGFVAMPVSKEPRTDNAEMEERMKEVGEEHEEENKEFQPTVADQCTTQKPLQVALIAFKSFYEKVLLLPSHQDFLVHHLLTGSRSTRRTSTPAV